MIDKTRVPAAKGTLPSFAPVPRHYNRHDGWTPDRQRGFIEALADSGSVKAAAHAVNMTPEGAYLLRRHPQAQEFRKAWEAALKLGVQRLEDVAMERALHGTEAPVYHFGAVVGTRRVYNDRLLMFILRNRATKRFAADGVTRGNAATRSELKRLRKEWRKEWDAEHAAKIIEAARTEVRESRTMRQEMEARHLRWWAGLSPRAREAYRAFRRIEQEDGEQVWSMEDAEAIRVDHDKTFANDTRIPLERWREADAIGDDKLPEEDADAAGEDVAVGRTFTLKDERRMAPIPTDGRARSWP
jgi:hypothetical protein